ncbi:MAG TPA: hypothetical protein VNW68_04555 [Candidatus Limnocylindria bacterium]|nr:hypothetical protein [Candidatus Limnocylindria bacterium]
MWGALRTTLPIIGHFLLAIVATVLIMGGLPMLLAMASAATPR